MRTSDLIFVDAQSKFVELEEMSSTTAGKTLLRCMLARYDGLLEQLVSDNSSQFVSQKFCEFMKQNSVKHINRAPYPSFSKWPS